MMCPCARGKRILTCKNDQGLKGLTKPISFLILLCMLYNIFQRMTNPAVKTEIKHKYDWERKDIKQWMDEVSSGKMQ